VAFVETHPFNQQQIPGGTRSLIVGTAPPPRFSNPNCKEVGKHCLDFPFFYGSGKSNLWKLMNKIGDGVGTPLPPDNASAETYAVQARSFLERHGLWMKDILQTYQRSHECSSLDEHIEPPRIEDLTDFRYLFEEHRSIDTVAFTSEQAAKWTLWSLRLRDLEEQYFQTLASRKNSKDVAPELDLPRDCQRFAAPFLAPIITVRFNDRDVRFFQLPSPSGSMYRPKGGTDDCFVAIYKSVLFSRLPSSYDRGVIRN
jgi:hypothetical protein